MSKYVDPKIYDLAFEWLSDYNQHPSKSRVLSLAGDIQSAIEAWADLDEQQQDEMRQLRGLSDSEKARI
jgi:hypothetical protein